LAFHNQIVEKCPLNVDDTLRIHSLEQNDAFLSRDCAKVAACGMGIVYNIIYIQQLDEAIEEER
jgi:hypothetical protein